jgi:hypothetical protein
MHALTNLILQAKRLQFTHLSHSHGLHLHACIIKHGHALKEFLVDCPVEDAVNFFHAFNCGYKGLGEVLLQLLAL